MTLLQQVHILLVRARIAHALVGAAALAARGVARSTYDIDLLTTDRRVLEGALWSGLRQPGVVVEVRRGDEDDPLAGVVRIDRPDDRPVDVIVGKQVWQARAVERAESREDGPPVVTSEDLVLLKLYAGGTQDLWDVREILALAGGDELKRRLDVELVHHSAAMRGAWDAAKV
jgi:hypothetical protein